MHRFFLGCCAAVLVAGCGSGGESAEGEDGNRGERPRLVVSAASSLTEALQGCSRGFPADVRLSFAGSDELAAQIRQGAAPDVFLAANTKLPEQLAGERLVQDPVTFATNELVVAVPADSGVRAIEDLGKDGTTVVIGSESVPVGAYTRTVLGRLPGPVEDAVLGNVRSEEPDVKGVVGKLTQGAADAGFTYASDVTATDGALRAVELPEALRPQIAYGGAVVTRAKQPELAQRFLDDVRRGDCAAALRARGFGAAPAA
jgi:molybdate transport system substrate-binding protein